MNKQTRRKRSNKKQGREEGKERGKERERGKRVWNLQDLEIARGGGGECSPLA